MSAVFRGLWFCYIKGFRMCNVSTFPCPTIAIHSYPYSMTVRFQGHQTCFISGLMFSFFVEFVSYSLHQSLNEKHESRAAAIIFCHQFHHVARLTKSFSVTHNNNPSLFVNDELNTIKTFIYICKEVISSSLTNYKLPDS